MGKFGSIKWNDLVFHWWLHNCIRGTRTQPLISVGGPVQLIGEIFWGCICVDTQLPRFEALPYVVPQLWRSNSRGDSWSCVPVFVKRCSFFLDRLRIKALFIFFLIGNSFSPPGTGIYFVTLVHRWNMGHFLFTSGLFIVFLVVFN